MASTIFAPAPWSLNGSGAVLLYHFPHSFVSQWGFLEDYQHLGYRGWMGAVLLVDYQSSNVGPYQELMFIPGLFKLGGKRGFSISKIWVSTEASLQNGQRNWGIPKELAQFEVERDQQGIRLFKASKGSRVFFEAQLKHTRLSLPFTSKLLPLTRIIQQSLSQLLLTRPQATGKIGLASLQKATADPDYFPPLQKLSPLACLAVPSFQMQFPIAQLLDQGR